MSREVIDQQCDRMIQWRLYRWEKNRSSFVSCSDAANAAEVSLKPHATPQEDRSQHSPTESLSPHSQAARTEWVHRHTKIALSTISLDQFAQAAEEYSSISGVGVRKVNHCSRWINSTSRVTQTESTHLLAHLDLSWWISSITCT